MSHCIEKNIIWIIHHKYEVKKMSLKNYQVFLEQSGIHKIEISKIMEGLRLIEKEGVDQKDIDVIVKKLAKDPNFRARFLKAPLDVTYGGGWSVK